MIKKKVRGNPKPPVVIDKKFLADYQKSLTPKKMMYGLTKPQQNDKDYLMGMFLCLKMALEDKVIDKFPDEDLKKYRYTPREMFTNIMKYFEVSITQGQPLTITGVGLFCGIRKQDFYELRTRPTLHPAFQFLKDAAEFVEMYNEYAAHKKMNPAGPIFILKNFGWKDKQEIELSSNKGALTDEERELAQKRLGNFSE